MRTSYSIKNSISSFVQYFIMILVGFVAQKVFINILGTEYLGLNGLFTNVVSMLGIVELGLGSAIIYNLYKPLAKKDIKTINALMLFYKKAYRIIAFIVFILGLLVIPFLPFIIKDNIVELNINIIYILFLLEITASYIFSYKRSILYADQHNFIINIIHIIYYVLMNSLQIIYLYCTKDYYGFLIIKIIMRLIENIVITLYVNSKYSYIKISKDNKLDDKLFKDIVKKVKALFFHKIGTFIVLGTDNIIISKYLGLITVGLYSNYFLIIDSINKLFGQAINSITPSIGNLLVENNNKKNYEIFKKIRFINFWIATFSGVGILLIMEPFIIIWLGSDYLLRNIVLLILVFNYYQKMMRNSFNTFKEGAGIYYEDRFVPILESVTNIIVSIILVKLIGLPGVFIGTIVSGLWLWFYSYPKFIYKRLFNRSLFDYFKETLGYIIIFVLICAISYLLSCYLKTNDFWYNFIVNCLITLMIPNITILLLFRNTDNFKYTINIINKKHTKN